MMISKLDRIINLQRRHHIAHDEYGVSRSYAPTWDGIRARAQLLEHKAEAVAHGSGPINRTLVRFRLRYVDGFEIGDTLTFERKEFEIQSLEEIGRRKWLEVTAIERP